jgi:hypothetical protein
MNKKALLVLLMIMAALPVRAETGTADPATLFLKANESFQQGDYQTAQDLYQKLRDSGTRNGKVFYNLGNTFYRQGKTGEAIQHYLLARQFIPRNEDLEANLGYARQQAEDRIEPASSVVLRKIFFWYDRFSVKEMAWIFLVCNLIFWSGLALRLFVRRPAVNWLVIASLLCGLTTGGTVAMRMLNEHLHQPAVVIVREVSVRSGMDPESTTLFTLHNGAEVSVEKTSADWLLVSIASGKKGWIRKEQVGLAVL